jgi:hypothetical protein
MEMLMLREIDSIKDEFSVIAINYLNDYANLLIYQNIFEEVLILITILLIYYFGMKRYKNRYDLIVKGFLILPK